MPPDSRHTVEPASVPAASIAARGDAAWEGLTDYLRIGRRRLLVAYASNAALAGAAVMALTALVALASPASLWLRATLCVGAALIAALTMFRREALKGLAPAALRIEARQPAFRNLLVTVQELAVDDQPPSRMVVSPTMRARVAIDAWTIAEATPLAEALPLGSAARRVAAAIGFAAVAIVSLLASPPFGGATRAGSSTASGDSGSDASRSRSAAIDGITVVVTPPDYSGAPTTTLRDPERVPALEGSRLHLVVASGLGALTVTDLDGRRLPLTASGRTHEADLAVQRSGFVTIDAQAAVDAGGAAPPLALLPVTAVADRRPVVTIEAPGADLVFGAAVGRVRFRVRASDDIGLRTLRLLYTRVSGSGEQHEFTDGELALRVVKENATSWSAEGDLALDGLDLSQGDVLVYRAEAFDARPDGRGVSETFIIEIASRGGAAAGGFETTMDEDRAAISQQMVVVKTERLQARRGVVGADAFLREAQGIAVEQRTVRAEFIFMMGGEIEDEDLEAAQSDDVQAGRLTNQGREAMRTATRLMSRAERLLSAGDPEGALPIERQALAAIERALVRQRYILRPLPARSQIDPSRRLSGPLQGARSNDRSTRDVNEDPRVSAIRHAIGELTSLASMSTSGAAADAPVAGRLSRTARDVLQIDPSSATLQRAAARLLSASRAAAPAAEAADWRGDVQTALTALTEMAAALMPPPEARAEGVDVSRLRGALADLQKRSAGATREERR